METTVQPATRKYKFQRQHRIGRYYADFCCVRAQLVVELDGSSHDDRQEYDALRDATMRNDGWRVIRIPNRNMINDEESVWLTIEAKLREHLEEVQDANQPTDKEKTQ